MIDIIYSWVRNIIIFLILTTVISNLLGKSSYKKYVDLITGLVLLLLVISPLFQLFDIENKLDYYFSSNFLLWETTDLKFTFEDMEISQQELIISEYKEQIKKQILEILEKEKLYVTTISVEIYETSGEVNYGHVKSINLVATYIKQIEESDLDKESSIQKIQISPIKIGNEITIDVEDKDDTQSMENSTLRQDEINAKKRLSDFYNVTIDNINISIQE